jgi:hypothetical protein
MEILHDAAVQERLHALDWRIPAGALKYHSEAPGTNGTSVDKSTEHQGNGTVRLLRLSLELRSYMSAVLVLQIHSSVNHHFQPSNLIL